MSDTPRTDALLANGIPSYYEHRKLCGQMEREIAQLQQQLAEANQKTQNMADLHYKSELACRALEQQLAECEQMASAEWNRGWQDAKNDGAGYHED